MRRAMKLAALAVGVVSLAAGRGGAENPAARPAAVPIVTGNEAGPRLTVTTPKPPARTLAAAILAAREQGAAREPASDRTYRIECVVIEREADGTEQVISRPQVMTLAGQPAHVQIGAATPLVTGSETTADGGTKPVISVVTTGTTFSLTVVPEQAGRTGRAGRAGLDLTMTRSALESVEATKHDDGTDRQSVRQSARIESKSARVLESIELGKKLVIGLDDKDAAKSKVRVELVVAEVREADLKR